MACLSPVLIRNKNTGYPQSVPCRKCVNCKRSHSLLWQVRLRYAVAELDKQGSQSTFFTLTYRDDELPDNCSLRKTDLVKFMKRLRYYSPSTFKYYAVGEYGDNTMRCHYHGIILGLSPEVFNYYGRKAWSKGFVTADICTSGRIKYIVDYINYESTDNLTKDKYYSHGLEAPFAIFSQGIGISSDSIDYAFTHNGYIINGNKKTLLPKYYRDKFSIEDLSLKGSRDFITDNQKTKASALVEFSRSNLNGIPINRDITFLGGHQR